MKAIQYWREKTSPPFRSACLLMVALIPALVMTIAAITNNHFALLDDGAIIDRSRAPFRVFFMDDGSGRFIPFFWIFNWALFKILPEQAWVLSLGNGLCVLASTSLVYYLALRLANGWAGVAAAWLFVLNLATTECLFTLSKPEPKQLPFWMVAFFLLAIASETGARNKARWSTGIAFSAAAAVLFKETGVLLAVPLTVLCAHAILTRKQLPKEELRRRLMFTACGLAPLAICLIPILTRNLASGSYALTSVLAGQSQSLWEKDLLQSTLLAGGMICGIFQLFAGKGSRRFISLMMLSQLAAIILFFSLLPKKELYRLHAASAFAAVLICTSVATLAGSSTVGRLFCRGLLTAIVAWGLTTSISGAAALSAWSWLYGRLSETVIMERPARVLFYKSGGSEVHYEADLTWRVVRQVPVTVGVLDEPPDSDPFVVSVPVRGLRVGDWVLEQFGTSANAGIPFRDLSVTHPEEQALINDKHLPLLPLRLLHSFKAPFMVPHLSFQKPPRRKTFLSWRIYEVTGLPSLHLEGLTTDRWMSENATLWLSPDLLRPVTLRMRALIPPGTGFENRLGFSFAGKTLDSCPATTGFMVCRFDPALLPAEARGHGWIAVELRAEHTFSPRMFGLNNDSRELSFNFGQPFESGWGGLITP